MRPNNKENIIRIWTVIVIIGFLSAIIPIATSENNNIIPLNSTEDTPGVNVDVGKTASKIFIDKTETLGPYEKGHRYYLHIFNVDDTARASVNGKQIARINFMQDSGWIDITSYLIDGSNKIRLIDENGIYGGWAYGFEIRQDNSKIIWRDSCGTVGKYGCMNDDQTRGPVYQSIITLVIVQTPIPTSLTVEKVWTMDGNNKDKAIFKPGDTIHYGVAIKNWGSSTVKATFTFLASGPKKIYSWTGQGDVPPGSPMFYSPSTIPTDAPAGTYNIKVTVAYNGKSSSGQSQFVVGKNTFYPGINWKTSNLKDLNKMANDLDSQLRRSYENTDEFTGAVHTYLASKGVKTQKNYLMTNDGDGYYQIAFAHSGGTQTLIQKIKTGKVTADYIVLVAPALIKQEELVKLIKDKKIKKKVIIFQSKQDLLYRFRAGIVREYKVISEKKLVLKYTNKWPNIWLESKNRGDKFPGIYILSDLTPSDFNRKQLSDILKKNFGTDNFKYYSLYLNLPLDITELLKSEKISASAMPEKIDRPWIGGANREKQELFKNQGDIITIDLAYNGKSSTDVHQALLKDMIQKFVTCKYPFNGKFEGLKKKGC